MFAPVGKDDALSAVVQLVQFVQASSGAPGTLWAGASSAKILLFGVPHLIVTPGEVLLVNNFEHAPPKHIMTRLEEENRDETATVAKFVATNGTLINNLHTWNAVLDILKWMANGDLDTDVSVMFKFAGPPNKAVLLNTVARLFQSPGFCFTVLYENGNSASLQKVTNYTPVTKILAFESASPPPHLQRNGYEVYDETPPIAILCNWNSYAIKQFTGSANNEVNTLLTGGTTSYLYIELLTAKHNINTTVAWKNIMSLLQPEHEETPKQQVITRADAMSALVHFIRLAQTGQWWPSVPWQHLVIDGGQSKPPLLSLDASTRQLVITSPLRSSTTRTGLTETPIHPPASGPVSGFADTWEEFRSNIQFVLVGVKEVYAEFAFGSAGAPDTLVSQLRTQGGLDGAGAAANLRVLVTKIPKVIPGETPTAETWDAGKSLAWHDITRRLAYVTAAAVTPATTAQGGSSMAVGASAGYSGQIWLPRRKPMLGSSSSRSRQRRRRALSFRRRSGRSRRRSGGRRSRRAAANVRV